MQARTAGKGHANKASAPQGGGRGGLASRSCPFLPAHITPSSPSLSFGFIEFLTKEEAKNAFESLGSSTHFYGRRLALDFANDDESVDAMRAKVARDVTSRGDQPQNKRIKYEDATAIGMK